MDIYNPVYPGLYYFDTFTFTTLGTSGHRGPDSTKTYANAPWREGDFSIVEGQQQWTVPATGTYRIEAAGAYGATPGRVVSGEVDLNEGQVVSLLAGQQPNPLVSNIVDNVTVGGGGGTFVTVDGTPLIVASGGDGGSYSTGYLRTELVIPTTLQTSLSMSADGTVLVALNLDIITFEAQYAVYRYSSGVWNFERSFNSEYSWYTVISGNGNTLLLFSSQSVRVFEYVNSEWTGPNLITDVIPWYASGGTRSLGVSYDGGTVILAVPSASFDQLVYVCTKNQDLTWNSLIQIQPADVGVNYFRYGSTYVAISGDGTSICVNTEQLYPYTRNSWVYTRTGESTWSSPVLLSSGSEPFDQIDMSYDGQIIALLLADPNLATIWLRVFTNGTLSKDITLPFPQTNYRPGVIKLSYDGSRLLFAQYFNVTLYTSDSQITVSDTVNEFPFAAASMDSTGSRIVNSAISLTNPVTYFFDAGGSGHPGSFLPSGTGSGVSGAGYLTDGQVSNPYFGFLKPQAYVDGGFGNMYWYGHKGEGGFGGGQSPLNKKTSLTSVTGYKQVRPSIPVNGVRQMISIALSDDGNTFLASGQRRTGTPFNFTNVYTYTESSWTNTNISDDLSYVSTSANGTVWLINGDVWRNGSFETTLDTIGTYSVIPGEPRSCISSDGNTAVVLSASYVEFGGIPYALNVYTYSSGTWTGTNLAVSQEIPNDIYALQCAISGDGNTVVLNLSGSINFPNFFSFVDVYKKVNGTWSTPNRIFTNTSIISNGTLGINSDGNEIVFANSNQKFSLYSNGTITTFPTIEDISFSRTNPDFYVYSFGNKIYAPSISLDVTVSINDKNTYIASGSNILATTDSSSPSAFVFVDMYDPTTTCTANTAVDHGYPHNYQIQITGTNSFDGTWDIVTATANTFTFQAFGGPTETVGYVSGTTTGISGGGGYTGSAGDGVSGATCYADPAVRNFTDLGATSNSAGYVTVSLVDPVPIKQTYDLKSTMTIFDVQVYNTFNWRRIVYSQGLDLFVILGRSDSNFTTSLYSKDGKLWYSGFYSRPLSGAAYGCLTWAPELGIFLATDTFPWFSSDGIHWTQDTSADNTSDLISITWIPFLRKFLGVTGLFSYPRGMSESSDGKTWSALQNAPVLYFSADETKSLMSSSDVVVVCDSIYVYSSTNGTDWDLTLTTSDTITSWAYGNGYFFVSAGFYYYYSKDGYTWQNGTYPIVYSFWGVAGTTTFLENSVMVTFPENSYISTDYINWTAYPNNLCAPPGEGMFSGTDYIGSVYTNKGYVVALLQRDVHLTVNGYVWIKAERPYIPAGPYLNSSYTGYAYSETSNVIVLTNSISIETLEKGVYYKNGSWKRIPGLDFYPQMCTWNPVSSLFELSETVSFDPFLETIVSGGQTSDWIVPSLLQTFYYQGLNNNLPLYKAFSLSGIIVDTYTGMGQPPPVSCDGTTFISSQESDTIRKTTDGVTWTEYNTTVTNIGDYLSFLISTIKYVSKYKLFFAFGFIIGPTYFEYQTSGIFTSVDGIEWTRVYSESFNVLLTIDSVLWDVNEDTFIIFYRNRNPTYFKLL